MSLNCEEVQKLKKQESIHKRIDSSADMLEICKQLKAIATEGNGEFRYIYTVEQLGDNVYSLEMKL